MIRQCAWCKRELGEIEPLDNKGVTHGICQECFDKELKKDNKD